jgi:glucose/mannose-6-phosphate isomerase
MKISEYAAKYDPQNQFDVLVKSYLQIEAAWSSKIDLSRLKKLVEKGIHSILVTGLGGSAISADLIQNFLHNELQIPLIVNRGYTLPKFVNKNSLIVISSYSGNTEETLSVFQSALEKTNLKGNIVCITTGGKAGEIASDNDVPGIKIQAGFQPRYALGLSFFSLLKVLQNLRLIENQDDVVNGIMKLWKKKGEELGAENNAAINTARKLLGSVPVIYSAADFTSAAGYRFKCQLNENSKMHAFHNIIPEMNHNEIIGWETYSEKLFQAKVINILDPSYHQQVLRRFKIISGLAAEKKAKIINLESTESAFKLRLLDIVYLCDWISYYSAVLRGFDPSEIEYINILKERLANNLP